MHRMPISAILNVPADLKEPLTILSPLFPLRKINLTHEQGKGDNPHKLLAPIKQIF